MKYILLALKTIFYCLAFLFIILATIAGYEIGAIIVPTESVVSEVNYYSIISSIIFFLASYALVLIVKKILGLLMRFILKD